MKEAIIEAFKEFLRVVLLAVVPVLIVGLENGNLNLRFVGLTAGIAFLRALDKVLHEWGKEENNKLAEGGLTRF